MENLKFKCESLKEVYDLCKKLGLKMFTSQAPENISYFFISDGEKIAYCESKYGCASFSTVHKPNRQCGTGFGLDYDTSKTLEQNILFALNCFAPAWASNSDRQAVKKYTSDKEYLKRETVLKYTYI